MLSTAGIPDNRRHKTPRRPAVVLAQFVDVSNHHDKKGKTAYLVSKRTI